MFEREVQEYEALLKVYREKVTDRALRFIRIERTDEHLVSFFFQAAISRMRHEIEEKKKQSRFVSFLF